MVPYLFYSLFLFTPDVKSKGKKASKAVRDGLHQLAESVRQIRKYTNMLKFLVARMIYNEGLATIFAFGGVYAAGTFEMDEQQGQVGTCPRRSYLRCFFIPAIFFDPNGACGLLGVIISTGVVLRGQLASCPYKLPVYLRKQCCRIICRDRSGPVPTGARENAVLKNGLYEFRRHPALNPKGKIRIAYLIADGLTNYSFSENVFGKDRGSRLYFFLYL
jgi:hypothetical protein